MYSGTATSDNRSKTVIRVGASTPDKCRITPLCSVPIQTTTTLNIQLFPSSGGDGQNRPKVTAGNSNTLAASGTSFPVNGRSTSQSTQYETNSQHHTASNTEFDSRSTTSTDSGTTSRDPPVLPPSSQAVIVDVHRSANSDDESVAPTSTAAFAATAVATAGTMTSSFGTETVTPTSVYVENVKQPTDAANVDLMASPDHQLPELSTKQNVCDSKDTKTAHVVDIGTSISGLNVVSLVGETTSKVIIKTVTSSRDVCADEEKVDTKADLLTKLAIKTESLHQQSLHQQSPANEKRVSDTVENSNRIDGGNREDTDSDEEAEEDDEENLTSFDDVDYRKKYSTFRFIGWDMLGKLKAMTIKGCRRVLIFKNSALLLIFKTSCATNKAGNDRRLLKLMADIAENCAKRLQMMKDIAKPSLSAEHMDSLPLSDGRQTGQHLAEISQLLGENVAITDVAYRFQPSEPNVYLGSYVKGAIESGPQYEIGPLGVVVVLTKKNKYATVEAFSEQLCQHIANSCPVSLGSFDGDRFDGRVSQCRRRRRGKQSQGYHSEEQLLLQSFTFDPTIIVAEAARRCLVTIDDFLLLQ